MKVEVGDSRDYLGDVIGDMNSRRGQVQGTDSRGKVKVVEAVVPLADMFGYVEVAAFRSGRAVHDAVFALRGSAQNVADEEVKAISVKFWLWARPRTGRPNFH